MIPRARIQFSFVAPDPLTAAERAILLALLDLALTHAPVCGFGQAELRTCRQTVAAITPTEQGGPA